MELQKLQAEVKPWVDHNFGPHPSYRPLFGAMEELGELSHAFLKKEENIRVSEDHDALMKNSVADIIIFLADFCNSMNYDLSDLVQKTWNSVKQRDWKRYPKNGISE